MSGVSDFFSIRSSVTRKIRNLLSVFNRIQRTTARHRGISEKCLTKTCRSAILHGGEEEGELLAKQQSITALRVNLSIVVLSLRHTLRTVA